MTQKERIARLEDEVNQLRRQVTELAIALATLPHSQQIITVGDPLPVAPLLPYCQPTPWSSPITCQSDIQGI
jgi:hypothetical protein